MSYLVRTAILKALASFPHSLNQEFAEIMPDEKFQKKVLRDAKHYRDGLDNDGILERAFGEIYVRWMEDFEQRADFKGESVFLYRGISEDSVSKINLKSLGLYWTWDAAKAGNYSGVNSKKDLYVVKAEVPLSAINLKTTLRKIVWPGYDFEESERELELKKGSSVTVISVTDKTGKEFLTAEVKGTV